MLIDLETRWLLMDESRASASAAGGKVTLLVVNRQWHLNPHA